MSPEQIPVALGILELIDEMVLEQKNLGYVCLNKDVDFWTAGFIACFKRLSTLSDDEFADMVVLVGNKSEDFILGVKWCMDLTKANDLRRQGILDAYLGALKKIALKAPESVGQAEAADMAIEFKQLAVKAIK